MNEDYYKKVLDGLGYKPIRDTSTPEFEALEQRVFEKLGIEPSFEYYYRDLYMESPTSYYVPVTYIGSCGGLLIKDTNEYVVFGSPPNNYINIWAYHENIYFKGHNWLEINKINNVEKTEITLKSFLRAGFVDEQLIPQFSNLPIKLDQVDLRMGIKHLFEARYHNYFDFKVGVL